LKEKAGIVAFSFALGEKEPNPCNRRLACEVDRIARKLREENKEVVIVSQWEVAEGLKELEIGPDLVITEHRQKGSYLDSDEVAFQAAIFLHDQGVMEVVPVAHPFLHLTKCQKLLRKAGFKVRKEKIRYIGFYPESKQWWTRGPLHLFLYAILQVLFERRGR